ncbi:MAG: hypothetical protein AAF799_29655 [Myxococcota bacterium]
MSFELSQTLITNYIEELEWGTAAQVAFSRFDSCMGLLGRRGNNVTGVHLVMAADRFFDDQAAALAASVVLDCNEVAVIGNVNTWAGNLPGPFNVMRQLIGGAWSLKTDRGRGNYGGRVQGGVLQYSYNGIWYNN